MEEEEKQLARQKELEKELEILLLPKDVINSFLCLIVSKRSNIYSSNSSSVTTTKSSKSLMI